MNFNWFKWLWLPLSLAIFGQYAVQHGLITVSKTTMVVPWFSQAISIFFLTVAISIAFVGILLDNISSRKVMLVATGLGITGLFMLNFSAWGFGIFFGLASALIKIIPFSGPMKLYTSSEAYKICPQAAAKNIGSIFFLLILGSLLIQGGWNVSVTILAIVFGVAGFVTYLVMPDDKIEGWKLSIFKQLAIDWRFWAMLVMFFFMSGWYYWSIPQFMPAIQKFGYSKEFSVYITCIALLIAAASRWPLAWLGTKFGHFKFMTVCASLQPIVVMFLLPINPLLALFVFQPIGAAPTPNYWPGAKKLWGPEYVGTVIGIGMVAMNIGAGIIAGKWLV